MRRGRVRRKELQGDVATELEVFRLVHNTHAPAADLAADAVMGNRLTHGLGWRGHWLDMLGGSAGKVNEAIGLPAPQEGCRCKIVLPFIIPVCLNIPRNTSDNYRSAFEPVAAALAIHDKGMRACAAGISSSNLHR